MYIYIILYLCIYTQIIYMCVWNSFLYIKSNKQCTHISKATAGCTVAGISPHTPVLSTRNAFSRNNYFYPFLLQLPEIIYLYLNNCVNIHLQTQILFLYQALKNIYNMSERLYQISTNKAASFILMTA